MGIQETFATSWMTAFFSYVRVDALNVLPACRFGMHLLKTLALFSRGG
jgi:hypothetical protein